MSFEHHREIQDRIAEAGLVAVVTLQDSAKAVPLAQALLAGGVRAMELTLRTPDALDSIAAIRADATEMLVGAGTVISVEQVSQVVAAGAEFAVSPGLNAMVVHEAIRRQLPFAPGVCTPSDIESAMQLGCRLLKFFPAEPIGGLDYLKAIAAPYAHLGIQFLPLGGIRSSNLLDYLQLDNVAAVGGSWMTPSDAIDVGDWSTVTKLANSAVQQIAEHAESQSA